MELITMQVSFFVLTKINSHKKTIMKNTNTSIMKMLSGMVLFCLLFVGCKKAFDEPPFYQDPDIPVTLTIKELKAKYKSRDDFQKIVEDKVISGVVIADDRSGNFYSQIVIQDETGGIPILIDRTGLYTSFPIGRRVFVKVKDLWLGDYGGTIQLGMDTTRSSNGYINLGRIPSALINNYIIAGSINNVVTPKVVSVDDFTKNIDDPLISTLVQINNVEFATNDTSKTFANAASPRAESARNFTLSNCHGKSIVLRNSSYATFASTQVPKGNGPLVGVASIFMNNSGATLQIGIRDTFDIQFKGARCNQQVTPPPSGATITIQKLKELYLKGDSTIPAGVVIEGTVVSNTANESKGNYRLQDGTDGIQLRFTTSGNPNASLGSKLSVNVGSLKFSIFQGGLQINNVESAISIGTGSITPRIATIADFSAASRAWESTVVKINNIVSITETGTGSTGKTYTIKDATGEVLTFVRSAAGITIPANVTSVTGYISIFQSNAAGSTPVVQLTLRSQDDLETGSSSGGGSGSSTAGSDLLFSEYVEGTAQNKYIEIYNAGTASADLSKYVVNLYPNGGTTIGYTIKLSDLPGITSTTLNAGGILVIKHASAALTLPSGVNTYAATVTNFNGDDALVLLKDDVVIDVIGKVGERPDKGWAVAGIDKATADHTIRRKPTVTKGNTDWAASAGTNANNSEWVVADVNDGSNLGIR